MLTTKIILGLLPIVVLFTFIYRADRLHREPAWLLILAFILGIASIGASMILSFPLSAVDYPRLGAFWGSLYEAFFCAAIPEEAAKLLMLWLILRKNKYFDEYFDGIVYAVCIGMGFAGLENLLYIIGDENWVTVAIMRAFLAVPGHFCYAVFMGYYYSLWAATRNNRYLLLAFVAPMLAHGVYDAILMVMSNMEFTSLILIFVFFVMMKHFYKHTRRLIDQHLQRDNDIYEMQTSPEDSEEVSEV